MLGMVTFLALAVVGSTREALGDAGRLAQEFGALSMYTLSGEGEYEGLSAVLTPSEDGVFKALVIDGGLPPFPELPAE